MNRGKKLVNLALQSQSVHEDDRRDKENELQSLSNVTAHFGLPLTENPLDIENMPCIFLEQQHKHTDVLIEDTNFREQEITHVLNIIDDNQMIEEEEEDMLTEDAVNVDLEAFENQDENIFVEEIAVNGDQLECGTMEEIAVNGDGLERDPIEEIAMNGDALERDPIEEIAVNGDALERDPIEEIAVNGNQLEPGPKKKRKGQGPYVRNVRKDRINKRHHGESYITAKNKFVPKRELKPMRNCRSKCSERFTHETRNKIFAEYWSLGSHDRRVQFISSLVGIKLTKISRKRKEDSSKKREVTFEYNFEVDGERKPVCKGCFLRTLDEKEKFVRLAIANKMKSTSGVTNQDKRGQHSPGNKILQEKIDEVIHHIQTFPTYESHYTRKTNEKKYLPSHLNLQKMYKLYTESTNNPASRQIYEREFHKLNLCFKQRKTDTCHKCDLLKMKIQVCENIEEKEQLLAEQREHHENADYAYESKRRDKNLAKLDPTLKCYTFDLQQCLPTPDLQTSVAFYKRLYWTYNLTIHDCDSNEAYCYLWHETIAQRGANEIASCLYKHIKGLPDNIEKVILYSDTCCGQNKNSHMAAMFTFLLTKKNTLHEVHHKFLVPGHTHMECDMDHSIIEKQKKKTDIAVSHPHDWATLIRCASKRFTVIEMDQTDFLNFAMLLKGPLVIKKENIAGQKFLWRQCTWLRYSKTFGKIDYKVSLNEEDDFKTLQMKRRENKRKASREIDVKVAYEQPLPISKEKKKDLLSLLSLIPPVYRQFYDALPVSGGPDIDPDLQDQDSDSEN